MTKNIGLLRYMRNNSIFTLTEGWCPGLITTTGRLSFILEPQPNTLCVVWYILNVKPTEARTLLDKT